MASVLNSRNLIYWWVFLTAFVFLQAPARDLARNLRNSQVFSVNSIPFSAADGLTRWIDDRAVQVVKTFQFDPNAIVVRIGTTTILDGQRVGFLLIVLLLILAVRFYTRAVASPRVYDDIIALIICFFVYHLVAQTLKAIQFRLGGSNVLLGDQMIAQRSTWVWFLGIVILAMVLGGKGFTNATIFWKGVIELFFVWLFLIPNDAAAAFAALLETLAGFGNALQQPNNLTWTSLWAIIGLILAIYRLYNGQPVGGGGARPAGGGARPPGGGGGGGGGLLKRLGGGRG